MGSRFSIDIFLLASLLILFPCIGYAQEKDTIPSMDIGEEVQRTMEQFPRLIPAQQWGKPIRYFYRCSIRFD